MERGVSMNFFRVVACILVFSIALTAQTEGKKRAAPTKAAVPAKATAKEAKKPQDQGVAKILGGRIVAIDNAKKTITVKVKSGEYPVAIDQKTVLTGKGNAISMADLKKGDYVTVNYLRFRDGSRTAETVNNKSFVVKAKKTSAKAPAKKEEQKQVKVTKVPEKVKPQPKAKAEAQTKAAPKKENTNKAQSKTAPLKVDESAPPKQSAAQKKDVPQQK